MNDKKDIIITGIKTSLLVGSLLTLINHGSSHYPQLLTTEKLIKIALCYLIPFCVSTFSATRAMNKQV